MNHKEHGRQDWMSDDQYECACLFADVVGGFHHIYGKLKAWGDGVETNVLGSWATFDFDQLTRIVVLGHDRMIRIEIQASGPRMFRVVMHKRHTREGRMSQKHPTIESAILTVRGKGESK